MCAHLDQAQFRWVSHLYNPDGTSAGQDVASLCEECLIALDRALVRARGSRTILYLKPDLPPISARSRENREASMLAKRWKD